MKEEVQVGDDGEAVFPLDLAEGLGAVRLTHLALEAVQGDDVPAGEFRSGPGRQGYQHRMLLTLLSYAYARGVFGSEDIQNQVRSDADLRYLCAWEFPDSDTLRQFRRREWIRLGNSLTRLLTLVSQRRNPGVPVDAAAEAARRMECAAAADSLALDC